VQGYWLCYFYIWISWKKKRYFRFGSTTFAKGENFYERYGYPIIDTTELEIDQVADCIARITGTGYRVKK